MPEDTSVQVLLVEDHPADIALTRKAFGKLQLPSTLHVVFDGREALSFLRRQGRYTDSPRPDLVLLDLNMPRMSGLEVLAVLDKDPDLRAVPVVVLTTSSAPLDVHRAYALCANGYVVKPVKFSNFMDLIESVVDYWFQTSILPPPNSP